jgi:hypothetical protein
MNRSHNNEMNRLHNANDDIALVAAAPNGPSPAPSPAPPSLAVVARA